MGQGRGLVRFAKALQTPGNVPGKGHGDRHVHTTPTFDLPATPRPERKPGEAGLRAGELMRRGDAPHRRAPHGRRPSPTSPGARELCSRAFRAKRRSPIRAKAQLSLGI